MKAPFNHDNSFKREGRGTMMYEWLFEKGLMKAELL